MRHVILDTDFGDGARFLEAWAEWRADAGKGPLHYLAIAPHAPAADALASSQLAAVWPSLVPGFHRIVLDEGRITLDLLIGALDAMLPQIAARVDEFYLPASLDLSATVQPPPLLRALARLARQGATLLAHAPDEALVWALTRVGFACSLVPGTQDLSAVFSGRRSHAAASSASLSPMSSQQRRAIVIGAGLAGSAACERLCAHGWDVTLIERHEQPAQEASGNLAGIFMPLLSKDDNIPTRLSRAAFLYALRHWQQLGGVGTAFDGARCGVLQLARDTAHARVQQDVIESGNYPSAYARWLDVEQASATLGSRTPHGGWLFEQGGWARPASLCQTMLDACGARLQRVFAAEALALERSGEEWLVRAADGATIAQAPTVILANGTGARALAQSADLPLQALRGQVTHLAAQQAPNLPLVVCREAYVTPAANGIVSAGATYDNDSDTGLRADSQQENMTRLAEILGDAADLSALAAAPLAGRVGFRCAAPDRLPLVGALPDYPSAGRLEHLHEVPRHPGLHGLLGYASRGLIWAPLMAELLVAQLEGAPLPLESTLAAALDPGRFLLKQRRRSQ